MYGGMYVCQQASDNRGLGSLDKSDWWSDSCNLVCSILIGQQTPVKLQSVPSLYAYQHSKNHQNRLNKKISQRILAESVASLLHPPPTSLLNPLDGPQYYHF